MANKLFKVTFKRMAGLVFDAAVVAKNAAEAKKVLAKDMSMAEATMEDRIDKIEVVSMAKAHVVVKD